MEKLRHKLENIKKKGHNSGREGICLMPKLLPRDADILPPTYDHIFKTLLTHPDAKPALIDITSATIDRTVKDAIVRNNELPAMDTEEKAERLDVNCVVDDA